MHYNDSRFLGLIWTFRAIYADKEYSKWRTGYDYPQNQLRNVARETSLTHYTLSLDVDVILAPGEREKYESLFNKFYNPLQNLLCYFICYFRFRGYILFQRKYAIIIFHFYNSLKFSRHDREIVPFSQWQHVHQVRLRHPHLRGVHPGRLPRQQVRAGGARE